MKHTVAPQGWLRPVFLAGQVEKCQVGVQGGSAFIAVDFGAPMCKF